MSDLFVNGACRIGVHLNAAMDWLCCAQDATDCGGVSGGYKLGWGWMPAYPETTGYIIPTFLDYASLIGDNTYIHRAQAMGDWEIDIQLPFGAVRGKMGNQSYPIVFNTGQVILGWMALYQKLNKACYLDSTKLAADWLVDVQDDDGKWSRYTYQSVPHAYHTRVSWALLEVFRVTQNAAYFNSAQKNILWTLKRGYRNGWFKDMGFSTQAMPYTHTIAYTLRGLLEASKYLEPGLQNKVLRKICNASKNIIHNLRYDADGQLFIPATFDHKWRSKDAFTCLTGNLQLAIIWLKLFQICKNKDLRNAARSVISQAMCLQSLNDQDTELHGAIAGSEPLKGKYMSFRYPNWAAKFFADALMVYIQEFSLEKSVFLRKGKTDV